MTVKAVKDSKVSNAHVSNFNGDGDMGQDNTVININQEKESKKLVNRLKQVEVNVDFEQAQKEFNDWADKYEFIYESVLREEGCIPDYGPYLQAIAASIISHTEDIHSARRGGTQQ